MDGDIELDGSTESYGDGDGELDGDAESKEVGESGENNEARELGEEMDHAEEGEISSNWLTDRKQRSRSCSCPREIITLIPHFGAKLGDEAGLAIVKRVGKSGRKARFNIMCQPHLRLLATGVVGLHNNKTGGSSAADWRWCTGTESAWRNCEPTGRSGSAATDDKQTLKTSGVPFDMRQRLFRKKSLTSTTS
jgi:hypothetical protein